MQEQLRSTVVLDGSNIIHAPGRDSDGNYITTLEPERLKIAIERCEELGWEVIACMKRGTYIWATRDEEFPAEKMELLNQLISNQKINLLDKNKEDIYIVRLALQMNAWLITEDKLRDEKKQYPGLDWDDIDSRKLGFEFVRDKFVVPGLLPRAESPTEPQGSVPTLMAERLNEMESRMKVLESRIIDLELEGSESVADHPITEEEEHLLLLGEVFNSMLSGGERVEMSHFQRVLASAILGYDITTYPDNWSSGWTKELYASVGFQGSKLQTFLNETSPRKLCFASRGSDEIESPPFEIFYC